MTGNQSSQAAGWEPPQVPRERERSLAYAALGGIMVLAAILRFYHLGQSSLWHDEGFSVYYARVDWATLWEWLKKREASSGLYYTLLHFWIRMGDSEAMIRSLSAIPSLLTIPVVYALGKRLFSVRAGLAAALILAVNAFHIRFAQEARSYSLLILFSSLSTLYLVRSLEQPRRANWIGYIVFSILAVYSHFFGALVLAAHWASLLFLGYRRVAWKAMIGSTLIIGAAGLPLFAFVVSGFGGKVQIFDWVPRMNFGRFEDFWFALTGANGKLLVLAYFVVCVIALLGALRVWRSSGASPETWRFGLLLSWLFVPIALTTGASLLKPVFLYRYLSLCTPPLALIAALGIMGLRPRVLSVGVLAGLLALAGRDLPAAYRTFAPAQEDWREVTQEIVNRAKPNDAVVLYLEYGRPSVDYYLDRQAHEGPRPAILELQWAPGDSLVTQLQRGYDRYWLVIYDGRTRVYDVLSGEVISPAVTQSQLASLRPRVEQTRIRKTVVYLFSREAGTGRSAPGTTP